MYQALYRKYRPQNFEEVVGQKVIIKTLSNSVLNNKISHAYLFTGPRGTGKTSIAKIFSKIVNCENLKELIPCDKCVSCTQTKNKQNTDVIEIDAASNNGVDEIRELRDKINLVPSYGKYKVYIIDEVHMLTTAAFNALLKTLEEPPKHIIFILATTEPHKIPLTILSRCQRFDFKKINNNDIISRIKYICVCENIEITDEAIELIAKISDGGMRDSLSLLDQLTAYTSSLITVEDVNEVYGIITEEEIKNLIINVLNNNLLNVFNLINEYDSNGKNLLKIIDLMIEFLKNTLIYYNDSNYFKEKEKNDLYNEICNLTSYKKINEIINELLEYMKISKSNNNSKLLFELAMIKIMQSNNHEQENKLEEIPIYDEKKSITTDKKIVKRELDENIILKINELKKIRINNALSKFDKKELLSFKKNLDLMKELLMNPDYSSNVSLILDGELKVKGNQNLIFVYEVKSLEECFNQSLIQIQKIFYLVFKQEFKPIAVNQEEWEKIKVEFNNNIKQNKLAYEYKDEMPLEKIFKTKEKSQKIKNNIIEENFEDIIVYN